MKQKKEIISRKERNCYLCGCKINIGDPYYNKSFKLSQFKTCSLWAEFVSMDFCFSHGFIKKEQAIDIWLSNQRKEINEKSADQFNSR